MQYFSTLDPVPDEGVHINTLLREAVKGLTLGQLEEIVANLAESGYVYHTIDDDQLVFSSFFWLFFWSSLRVVLISFCDSSVAPSN